MPQLVTTGAMMTCTFGMAPSVLNVLPTNKTMAGAPAANIMDCIPMTNIPPFAMCMSIANPTVAAATAAALGVLTPMPCIPVTQPWVPGSATCMLGGMPALNSTSMCMCAWGGMIQIGFPGQVTTNIP
jgi:uncharacterized protein DUF4280